jgi:hypothetical protein
VSAQEVHVAMRRPVHGRVVAVDFDHDPGS